MQDNTTTELEQQTAQPPKTKWVIPALVLRARLVGKGFSLRLSLELSE